MLKASPLNIRAEQRNPYASQNGITEKDRILTDGLRTVKDGNTVHQG